MEFYLFRIYSPVAIEGSYQVLFGADSFARAVELLFEEMLSNPDATSAELITGLVRKEAA